MTIHARIRAGRERLGLNEQQFADRLGVTRAAVQFWEREGDKGTAPARKMMPKVAAVLGMSVAELISGDAAPASGLSPEGHLLGSWLDRVTAGKSRSRAYVAAMQAMIEFLPGHDLVPSDEHIPPEPEEIKPAKRPSRQAKR